MSGCVSNQSVQTIQMGDTIKSCPTIKSELTRLGAKFDDAKEDSGVTGKNVGLAIVFWPGIIVNEVRASKNQDSIDDRVAHLSNIYNERCLDPENNGSGTPVLSDRLRELKELHEQGLINESEYDVGRQRALEEL
ncbi:MAG TPA: hypothetical protein EYN01_09635 [Chromatiales bacterium]|nr:hypothetical protein [Chromatiales bacterium]